jgi:hypothetical protein
VAVSQSSSLGSSAKSSSHINLLLLAYRPFRMPSATCEEVKYGGRTRMLYVVLPTRIKQCGQGRGVATRWNAPPAAAPPHLAHEITPYASSGARGFLLLPFIVAVDVAASVARRGRLCAARPPLPGTAGPWGSLGSTVGHFIVDIPNETLRAMYRYRYSGTSTLVLDFCESQ